eukprot:SAG31_NODE_12227_length_957_cov_1.325175_2_plen_207_part_01
MGSEGKGREGEGEGEGKRSEAKRSEGKGRTARQCPVDIHAAVSDPTGRHFLDQRRISQTRLKSRNSRIVAQISAAFLSIKVPYFSDSSLRTKQTREQLRSQRSADKRGPGAVQLQPVDEAEDRPLLRGVVRAAITICNITICNITICNITICNITICNITICNIPATADARRLVDRAAACCPTETNRKRWKEKKKKEKRKRQPLTA